jgi:hypothetical protein
LSHSSSVRLISHPEKAIPATSTPLKMMFEYISNSIY